MVLEGAMIVLAVALLTVIHPGVAMGDTWQKATFAVRAAKDRNLAMNNIVSTRKGNES
jgi:hypothetical protein